MWDQQMPAANPGEWRTWRFTPQEGITAFEIATVFAALGGSMQPPAVGVYFREEDTPEGFFASEYGVRGIGRHFLRTDTVFTVNA